MTEEMTENGTDRWGLKQRSCVGENGIDWLVKGALVPI